MCLLELDCTTFVRRIILICLDNSNGSTNLLIQGLLDGISAGILTYDVLISIIQPHFAKDSFKSSSIGRQFLELLSLWMGATIMSLIGIWA